MSKYNNIKKYYALNKVHDCRWDRIERKKLREVHKTKGTQAEGIRTRQFYVTKGERK
jgi:hypothetical protein